MKKVFALVALFALTASMALAQKTGYVDSGKIMDAIPEYKAAQDEIENVSQKWQQDLEAKYKAIEKMYADYQAQEVLMPDDLKQEKQEEIFQAEREAKEYREQKFGYNGELFTLQESKVKPIQDKVFRAVEAVAQRKRFNFIFDKSGETTWMYTDATYDLTDEVMSELGVGDEGR
ncbi:MAG: OmpH family outer membrane protein [Bacteroidota bacterium]